jgi:hypothetical protein
MFTTVESSALLQQPGSQERLPSVGQISMFSLQTGSEKQLGGTVCSLGSKAQVSQAQPPGGSQPAALYCRVG